MMLYDLGERIAWKIKWWAGVFATMSIVALLAVLFVLMVSFICDIGHWIRG